MTRSHCQHISSAETSKKEGSVTVASITGNSLVSSLPVSRYLGRHHNSLPILFCIKVSAGSSVSTPTSDAAAKGEESAQLINPLVEQSIWLGYRTEFFMKNTTCKENRELYNYKYHVPYLLQSIKHFTFRMAFHLMASKGIKPKAAFEVLYLDR